MKTILLLLIVFGLSGCISNKQRDDAYEAGYRVGYNHSSYGHIAMCAYRYHPEQNNKFEYVGVGNEEIYGDSDWIIRIIEKSGIKRRYQ